MGKIKPLNFQVGDVVYLKSEDRYSSTKIRMTVKSIVGEYPEIKEVECIWLSKSGIVQTHKFEPLLLVKY